jgi:thiol-disulfide isomerase/thioredoxin
MKNAAIVAAVVVAGLAGTVAYVAYDQLKSRRAHTPAPAPAAATPSSQLVETLPQFQLADRAGQMRSLQDWPDRALIVNFWATWCAPCRREIPLLQRLQRDHAGEGFQVIGIAVDFRDKVLAYADEMQIDYPLLIGEQEALDAAAAFGMTTVGLPFTVFSDRRGRIVTAHLGELTAAEADLILEAVRRVDAGATTPADARATLDAALAALPGPESAEE